MKSLKKFVGMAIALIVTWTLGYLALSHGRDHWAYMPGVLTIVSVWAAGILHAAHSYAKENA